jgi:hypothetical protein
MATILSLNQQVAVPFGTFHHCLQTQEFSPLEPGVKETKYYKRGIGFLESFTVQGPSELLQLVRITSDDERSAQGAPSALSTHSPGASPAGFTIPLTGEESRAQPISTAGASHGATATGPGSDSSAHNSVVPVHAPDFGVQVLDRASLSTLNRQVSDDLFAAGLPFDDLSSTAI